MTTICYRDGVMAGDTAVFDRGVYCGQALKIGRAADGTVGGAAGALCILSRMTQWLDAGAVGDPERIPRDEDSEMLWVRPDGSVWWMGPDSIATHLSGEYFAIGSGFKLAIGAMAFGASAMQAIEICADLDNMTRRPVQALTLGAEMVRAAE